MWPWTEKIQMRLCRWFLFILLINVPHYLHFQYDVNFKLGIHLSYFDLQPPVLQLYNLSSPVAHPSWVSDSPVACWPGPPSQAQNPGHPGTGTWPLHKLHLPISRGRRISQQRQTEVISQKIKEDVISDEIKEGVVFAQCSLNKSMYKCICLFSFDNIKEIM